MAVLTTKARKNIPASKFGIPPKNGKPGKYPEEDKPHAANAKARVTAALAKGKVTPEQAAAVRHKANVVLGETDSTYHSMPGK
jgi:hypothetical protein